MGAPHNKARYGEEWDHDRIAILEAEIRELADLVVVSGGFAWHFMSVKGHPELKHAHDHKDLDFFVDPVNASTLATKLVTKRGFEKVWTKYDRLPSSEGFRRYEKRVEAPDGTSVKVTIDLFTRKVPSITVDGVQVVEPSFLLSLYGKVHSSDQCFAVQAARKLIAQGISPVGRKELTEAPR